MTIIENDIFKAFEENVDRSNKILIHQANCFHVMGAGIAAEIKRRYPAAYEVDVLTDKSESKMGTFSYAYIQGSTKENNYCGIANVYSQGAPGDNNRFLDHRATSYDAVFDGVSRVCMCVNAAFDEPVTMLVPFGYGCGIANGNWTVVGGILTAISSEYKNKNINFMVCKKT